MRYNTMPFTSAICWLSFWIGSILIGASWLYARLQEKAFLVGLAKGFMNVTSPDSTVALLLSIGVALIVIGFIFVPLHYCTVYAIAFVKVLTRVPIRI
ncbi:hypothetical protein [Arsenophonus nasoniae]|uniref:hypothetical protein n=1 Tax=Arsenophonus nasoniae TaxID=638 RepID=UPI003879880F